MPTRRRTGENQSYPTNSRIPNHLRRSNDPPLAAERVAIAEQVTLLEQNLRAIEMEIGRLEEPPATLKTQKSRIKVDLLDCKSILSPIRLLPRELVWKIFLNNFRDTSLDATRGPWVIARVCRLWRQEILSRHSIWARIRVNEEKDRLRQRNATLNMLRTAIYRAQDHPLDIELTLHKPVFGWKLLSIAVEHSTQWKSVALHLSSKLWETLTANRLDIPILEDIHLRTGDHWARTDGAGVTGACFAVAPSLRRVSLVDLWDPTTARLPWSQITHFRASGCWSIDPSAQHAALGKRLRRMLNLTYLDLDETVTSNAPLSLPNLTSLSVHRDSSLLGVLKSPGLRTVILKDDSQLEKLASQSIETLTICDGLHPRDSEATDRLMTALSQLSNLTKLELRRIPSENFFTAFANSPGIFPKLQVLIFSDHFLGAWCLEDKKRDLILDWVESLAERDSGPLREVLFDADMNRMPTNMRFVSRWNYHKEFGALRKSHGLLVDLHPHRDRWTGKAGPDT